MRMRGILAATAATVLVAGLGVVGATPAFAIPLQEITSLGPGSAPSSLVVSWTADNTENQVYVGIALAGAFSPSNPCDWANWDTAASNPDNHVGYFYQGDVSSNPLEFTSYVDWNSSSSIAVEPSTEYVACYFGYLDGVYANLGSGSPVYGMSSGSGASGARPIWFLAVGRASADATCPRDYTPSWAQWPNAGTGGWVCNREVFADEPLS